MKQKDKDTFEDRIQCETIDEGNAGTIDRLLVNVSYMKSRKRYYLSVYPAGNSKAGSEFEVIHITQGGVEYLGDPVARFNAKVLAQVALGCQQSIESRSGITWEFITKIALREGLKIKGWDDQDGCADLKAITEFDEFSETGQYLGTMPTKAQADAVEPVNGRAEFVTAMTDLTHFMSRQHDPTHATSRQSAIQEMIDSAEGDELTIYCENDCDVDFTSTPADNDLDGRNEAERQHRTDQDAGLEDRGDTGLEGGYGQ